MNADNQPIKIVIDDWVFRLKSPTKQAEKTRILLLLHGHLGNENAMWVLTKPLPTEYTLLAPRAPMKMGENQYSWHDIQPQWPEIDLYRQLTNQLLRRVDSWATNNTPEVSHYDLMGFSQGAVMAYALAILHPEKVGRTAAIASFIPQNWKQELDAETLKNQSFFVAHGTKDEIIPLKKAQQSAQWLEEKGAQVNFCTADTGHKISANCFNGLGEFFKRN